MSEECRHEEVVCSEVLKGAWKIQAQCTACGKTATAIAGWVAVRKLRGQETEMKKGRR